MKKRCGGRPRCFESEKVLDAASELFWRKGYTATSLSDLVEATGLNKGSLYSSFGDKHTVFLKCLKRYLEGQAEKVEALLEAGDLLGCFRFLAFPEENKPCGCLAGNSLTELAPHDEESSELLRCSMETLEKRVGEALEATGRCKMPIETAARTFCSLALATRARTRSHQPDEVDRGLGESVLGMLLEQAQ